MITIILGMLIGALKLGHDFHSLGARGIELIFTGILGAIFGGFTYCVGYICYLSKDRD